MSWDVLLQRFPEHAANPEDVPDDYCPPAVGSRIEVASQLRKLFRETGASASNITIERRSFAIEINTGDEEQCAQLLLHVRGDATKATQAILRIANHFQMRAIDCSSSEFISTSKAVLNCEELEKERADEERYRSEIKALEKTPVSRPEWPLPGLTEDCCVRHIYVTLKPGESPKRLQNAVFQYYDVFYEKHGDAPKGIMGPSFLLMLPDGELFGNLRVTRDSVLGKQTEEEMVPRVEQGDLLLREFASATARHIGVLEQGAFFLCDDGCRIPLTECRYRLLFTDADYSMKSKTKIAKFFSVATAQAP